MATQLPTTPGDAPAVTANPRPPAKRKAVLTLGDAHPYDFLPFCDTPVRGGGRIFWAPKPTGDIITDTTIGEGYALAALRQIKREEQEGRPSLLNLLVLGIAKHGQYERDQCVLIGMFSVMQRALRITGSVL